MIIEREINGEIKQIELTEKEIYSAYLEQQHIYDRQIIIRALEYYLNDGDDKDFYEKYEIPFNEVYQNDEVIDELAHEMRKNQDKYDMSWEAARDDAFKDVLYEYKEKYSMRAVPKDKIMIAVLDDSYYAEKGSYPAGFDSDLPCQRFVFDTPEEFIKNWYGINEGAWYWVFNKGELICSGAVDPGDIEIFEEHFDMTFEEPDIDKEIEESSEEDFKQHILSQLTEKGFDVSQIELEIIEFKDNDHKDCSWYGGAVAEVKYKDYLFSLEARGDINCTLFDKNENELGYVKDRNNAGRFCSEMAHCLANDAELHEAEKDGRLVFENNNWFEIFVLSPDKEWQTMTWLSESDNIEECVFEMIETMDEMIEELNERKQEKKKDNIDKAIEKAKKLTENTKGKQSPVHELEYEE